LQNIQEEGRRRGKMIGKAEFLLAKCSDSSLLLS
jgi:hypothetical protein